MSEYERQQVILQQQQLQLQAQQQAQQRAQQNADRISGMVNQALNNTPNYDPTPPQISRNCFTGTDYLGRLVTQCSNQ